ncbi:hypothetical protein FB451DRAFT_434382 [Mycena latifolia]|nr:hypothetical protein FB451DRAFT_434382 [Mycena latifolia]
MDIPRTESSSSYFFYPQKSSSPIEIPGRQQHDPEPTTTRPMSPELIFEMEPFSPLDVPSTHYSFGHSPSRTADEREPLLYPFPMLSASRFNADRRTTHPAPQSTPGTSSSPPPIAHPVKPSLRAQPLQLPTPRQTPAAIDPEHAIRAVPRHKVTGFKPDFAAQAPEPRAPIIKTAPREKCQPPAPPPRRVARSFSSSPRAWRIPVRYGSDASDDEPRSLDVDPGAFTQYLLRRIDSQKPLQFQSFRIKR